MQATNRRRLSVYAATTHPTTHLDTDRKTHEMTRSPRRRGNAEGSVYAETRTRSDGTETERWVAQIVHRGRKRRTIHTTEARAKRALRDMLRAADDGALDHGNMTVKQLLDEWQTKALPNRNLAPATIARHGFAAKTITTHIGSRRIRTLEPDDIEAMFADLANDDMAKATLAKLRTTLGMALAWAERRGHVTRNVARVAELPADARAAEPSRSMTNAQATAFLAASEQSPLAAMWVTMLYLGLRPGEAAGLSWDDVDLDRSIIHVNGALKRGQRGELFVGAPKTKQSVRSLDAPQPVVDALRRHRQRQNRQRLSAGALWHNHDDLVFTNSVGGPVDPARSRYDFHKVAGAANLGDGWTPNMLRHTCASLMSDAGAPLELVADQLGHRDTRMASLHYRHRVRPTVSGGATMAEVLSGSD